MTATAPVHNDVVVYRDALLDPAYTTGWHSEPLKLEDMFSVEVGTTAAVAHNEVLAYNIDNASMASGWVSRSITSLFTGLESTITGIVGSANASIKGQEGNAGLTDMVMMSSELAGSSSTANISVGSSTDNNTLSKRELTDASYVFAQTLSRGEVANLTYTTGLC